MPTRTWIHRHLIPVALSLAVTSACVRRTSTPAPPAPASFTLGSELILTAKTDPAGFRLGGLSGLVALRDGRELLALTDDSDDSRVLRLGLASEPGWTIEPLESIRLAPAQGAPARLDPEGIALTSEGHILISSEGLVVDGERLPPSINEYSPGGRFIRQLPVRSRYAPNPTGLLATGVRSNAGFESLTTSPDFSRLFTATEIALVQDGDDDPFAADPRTRLLEYVRQSGGYEPAREFAYALDALPRPAFPLGFAVNGLVELLAVSNTELLALERAFVEARDKTAVINRLRIFRVRLDGAMDIADIDGLSGRPEVRAVTKVLVADLSALNGLSPKLSNLDNFEGLAWGPPDRRGVRPLIVVSDDNFSASQVTAFLFLQPGRAVRPIR